MDYFCKNIIISVVCVYNKPDILESYLQKSLYDQDIQCEFIALDNTQSQFSSAAESLNFGSNKANCDYLMFIHQDVTFSSDWLTNVLEQISCVEKINKQWGVIGLMGMGKGGRYSGHITDLHGHLYQPPLPHEVESLDEVCLIIRKKSGLCFDESLGGFHLYGADLCLQAMTKGLSNYAIDACVQHMGQGIMGQDFWITAERLYAKWKVKDCPISVIETTCGVFRLQSGLRAILEYKFKKLRRRLRKHIQ